ncbi:MAG: polymer-forming cytoskeletal protein [Acetobacteraceae bacterium]|nr:polymer-forming cytoskeletal protein [Acetobacteraceae bacterium]
MADCRCLRAVSPPRALDGEGRVVSKAGFKRRVPGPERERGQRLRPGAGRRPTGMAHAGALLVLAAAAALLCGPAAAAAHGFPAGTGAFFGDLVIPKGTVCPGDATVKVGRIEVSGRVEGCAFAALGGVEVGPSGRVAEDVRVAVGDATVGGSVEGSVKVGFGRARVDGRVGGSVELGLGQVELGPGAYVAGDVIVERGRITASPAARVAGRVAVDRPVGSWSWAEAGFFRLPSLEWPWWMPWRGFGPWAWLVAGSLGRLVAWLALGLVAYLLFPRALERQAGALARYPGWVALAGIGSLAAFPVAVLALVVTLVGIAAIPALAVGLVAAGGFGCIAVALTVGRLVRGRGRFPVRPLPFADVVIGVALLWALGWVPLVGWLFSLAAALFGLGVGVSTVFGAFEPWFLRLGRWSRQGV